MRQKLKNVMKKIMSLAAVAICSAALFTSCGLYTDYTSPVTATSNPVGKKVGMSSSTNVLYIVDTGDGGINKAAKDGGIKKISHVDQNLFSILGIFTTRKTFVYGE